MKNPDLRRAWIRLAVFASLVISLLLTDRIISPDPDATIGEAIITWLCIFGALMIASLCAIPAALEIVITLAREMSDATRKKDKRDRK